MAPLPVEVVSLICSHLGRDDLKNFRLASKSYSEIGKRFFRHTDHFLWMRNWDFEKLVELSELKGLAWGLESLEYAPLTLCSPAIEEPDFAEALEYMPEGTEYNQYKAIVAEQDSIAKDDKDYQWFLSTLPRFPRLRHITIYCGDYDTISDECNESHPMRKIQDFSYDIDFTHPKFCIRHLEILLRAISDSKISLESLKIHRITWQFFQQEDTRLFKMFQQIANLKHLELIIDGRDVDGGVYISGCYDFLRAGIVRKCLSKLTNLRSFLIRIDESNMGMIPPIDSPEFMTPLTELVPSGSVWTQLSSLRLENLACDRHDMMEVLYSHKETLRELYLSEIHLVNTSCIRLLSSIRNELLLSRPFVIAFISGCAEGGKNKGRSQYWQFHSSDGHDVFRFKDGELIRDLGVLVHQYLLDGGRAHPEMEICPLKWRNIPT